MTSTIECTKNSGKITFMSQCNSLDVVVDNTAKDLNLNISRLVSTDTRNINLLETLMKDNNTDPIMLYLESIDDPSRFREVCTRISKEKPIIALKTGSDKASNALLAQCGIIRETKMEKMFIVAQGFANAPLPKGNRVAILTNVGGPGIMATDMAVNSGLEIVKLTEKTTERLKTLLAPSASALNPVDTIATASIAAYEGCLNAILEDPNVDAVVAIMIPLGFTTLEAAQAMMRAQAKYGKPVLGSLTTTNEDFKQIYRISDLKPIPFFKLPDEASYALGKMYQYSLWKNKPIGNVKTFNDVNKSAVVDIITRVLNEKRDTLTTLESMDILRRYGINTAPEQKTVKGQREIMMGSTNDPQYGQLMMFGLGGIYTETMKEVVFRTHPITDQDAEDMLKATKAYQLMKGFRGLKGVDMDKMKEQLLRLSQLLTDFNFIDELDINPLIITDQTGEVLAVDARIKLSIKTKEELKSLKTYVEAYK